MVDYLLDILDSHIEKYGTYNRYVLYSLPNEVIDALEERVGAGTAIPWLILTPGSNEDFEDRNLENKVYRLIEEDIISFRTFSNGISGYLIIVPVGLSLQSSLENTVNRISGVEGKVIDRILESCGLDDANKKVIESCINHFLLQEKSPEVTKEEFEWKLISRLARISRGDLNKYESLLRFLGFPKGVQVLDNIKSISRIYKSLCSLCRKDGIRNTMENFSQKLNLQHSGKEWGSAFSLLYDDIVGNVSDAISFEQAPFCGFSNYGSGWWDKLTLDIWEELFEGTDKNGFEIKPISPNRLIGSQGIYLFGDGPIVFSSAPKLVDWYIGKELIASSTDQVGISEMMLTSQGDIKELKAIDVNGKSKKLNFCHLSSSSFPLVIDSPNAKKISKFKKSKDVGISYECDVEFYSVGSNTLNFFFRNDIDLGSEILGLDASSDSGEDTYPITKGGQVRIGDYGIGYGNSEIFTDESCVYKFQVLGPSGEPNTIALKIKSLEYEPKSVASYLEANIELNLFSKVSSSRPKVIIPTGLPSIGKWVISNKGESFNPIALCPDLGKFIHLPESNYPFKKEEFLISENYGFEKGFDYRHKDFQSNPLFSKLIGLRSSLIDHIFGVSDLNIDESVFLEGRTDLTDKLLRSDIGNKLLTDYIAEYIELFNTEDSKDLVPWWDTLPLYWPEGTTGMIGNAPLAVILHPLHPLNLAWVLNATQLLEDAISANAPCPIAGLLTKFTLTKVYHLPRKGGNKDEYLSLNSNHYYWQVYWNTNKLPLLHDDKVKEFLGGISLVLDTNSASLSANQVGASLRQIEFLLPAKNSYRLGVIGDGHFGGFNTGVLEWMSNVCSGEFQKELSIAPLLSEVSPPKVLVYDFRKPGYMPDNDLLNHYVNEKDVTVSWFRKGNSDVKDCNYDISFATRVESKMPSLVKPPNANECFSLVSSSALFNIDFDSIDGNAILEPLASDHIIGGSNPLPFSQLLEVMKRANASGLKDSVYKYSPGLSDFKDIMQSSQYSVVPASGLDISYVVNHSLDLFLWDYEMPGYNKSNNSIDGYYMVSADDSLHVEVINKAFHRLTDEILDEATASKLLNWMNKFGILSLKNLSSGGSMSLAEVGVLSAYLLLQPSVGMFNDFPGLFPASSERYINLLVPVDPFRQRISTLKDFTNFSIATRPDFLLFQFPKDGSLNLSVRVVEVKARTNNIQDLEIKTIIERQAEPFLDFLRHLRDYKKGEVRLWQDALPLLISEMVKFSLGLANINHGFTGVELAVVKQGLARLWSDPSCLDLSQSIVVTVSKKSINESYNVGGKSYVINLSSHYLKQFIDGDWRGFKANSRSHFLEGMVDGSADIPADPVKGVSKDPNINMGNGNGEDSGKDHKPSTGQSKEAKFGLSHVSPAKWEQQYNDVIGILSEHGVNVLPNDGIRFIEGPAFVTYNIILARGMKVGSVERLDNELKLGLHLSHNQNIRFKVDAGYIRIEVPKTQEDRYFVGVTDLWLSWAPKSRSLSVPVGVDQEGHIVDIDFSDSNTPHLLIGGSTGSGKSEALNTILRGLCHFKNPKELRLLLVDPKGTELNGFEDSPFLLGNIGLFPEDAIQILEMAVKEMEDRYAIFRKHRVNKIADYNDLNVGEKMPWWLIVLDEYGDLTSGQDDKKSIEDKLKRLAQKARAAGIHLVITTQKPSSEVISTNIRSNLGMQIALRVKGGAESRVILDQVGAEALNGMGDALLNSTHGLRRIQVALYK